MRNAVGDAIVPLVDQGLELLSETECRDLLRGASVGRVGVSVNALPVILPVNYRIFGDAVRFWSSPGLKLHAAQDHNVVAFEIDEFDEDHQSGWSVLAVGLAAEVVDSGVIESTVEDGLRPWADGERSHLVEVSITFLSGRRIVRAPVPVEDQAP